MSEEKDKEQLKREAAQRAKELALKKLAERKALAEGNDQAVKSEENLEKSDSTNLANKEEQQYTEKSELTEKTEKVENSQELQVDDITLAKQKAAAAAKAKAAAAAKAKAAALAKQQGTTEEPAEANTDDAKAKPAAAAKAKAAAAAKAKAAALAKQQGTTEEPAEANADDAKAKAIAAAKAKAAAAAAAKAKATAQATGAGAADDVKAKAIAAAKAKAAAAAAKAKAAGGAGKTEKVVVEEKPRPNQVYLDKYVRVIAEHLGEDVLEDAYLNPISKDVPTLVAKVDTYFKVAEFLKYNEQLGFDYLSEIHGSDFETHMEVYVHLYSYKNRQSVALKVKIDRDQPVIDSIQPLWEGANWPEREAYDLLGITFKNHPKLERILLPNDWVGHPLRKDYEPYDVGV